MKYLISLIIAAVFIGFVCFAIFYWIFKMDILNAMNIAVCAASGGLIAEFIRLRFEKRKRNKITGR